MSRSSVFDLARDPVLKLFDADGVDSRVARIPPQSELEAYFSGGERVSSMPAAATALWEETKTESEYADAGIVELCKCLINIKTTITHLDLSGCTPDEGAMKALVPVLGGRNFDDVPQDAESKNNNATMKYSAPVVEVYKSRIRILDLSRCRLTAAMIDILVRGLLKSPTPTLQVLNVSESRIGDAGGQLLAKLVGMQNPPMSLLELHMANCGLSSKGTTALADALQGNATLTELSLASNKMTGSSVEALCSALSVPTSRVSVLNLSHNNILRSTGHHIARMVRKRRPVRATFNGREVTQTSLHSLNLSHNYLASSAVDIVAAVCLDVSGVEYKKPVDEFSPVFGLYYLNLGHNSIDQASIGKIGEMIETCEVVNSREESGVQYLPNGRKAPSHSSILRMSLAGNNVGRSVAHLVHGLAATERASSFVKPRFFSCTFLDLSQAGLDSSCAGPLADLLRHCSSLHGGCDLNELILDGNPTIGDEALSKLFRALLDVGSHGTLTHLSVSSCSFGKKCIEVLKNGVSSSWYVERSSNKLERLNIAGCLLSSDELHDFMHVALRGMVFPHLRELSITSCTDLNGTDYLRRCLKEHQYKDFYAEYDPDKMLLLEQRRLGAGLATQGLYNDDKKKAQQDSDLLKDYVWKRERELLRLGVVNLFSSLASLEEVIVSGTFVEGLFGSENKVRRSDFAKIRRALAPRNISVGDYCSPADTLASYIARTDQHMTQAICRNPKLGDVVFASPDQSAAEEGNTPATTNSVAVETNPVAGAARAAVARSRARPMTAPASRGSGSSAPFYRTNPLPEGLGCCTRDLIKRCSVNSAMRFRKAKDLEDQKAGQHVETEHVNSGELAEDGILEGSNVRGTHVTSIADTVHRAAWVTPPAPLEANVHDVVHKSYATKDDLEAEDVSRMPLLPTRGSLFHSMYPGPYGSSYKNLNSVALSSLSSAPYGRQPLHEQRGVGQESALGPGSYAGLGGRSSVTSYLTSLNLYHPPKRFEGGASSKARLHRPYSATVLSSNAPGLPVTVEQLTRKFEQHKPISVPVRRQQKSGVGDASAGGTSTEMEYVQAINKRAFLEHYRHLPNYGVRTSMKQLDSWVQEKCSDNVVGSNYLTFDQFCILMLELAKR